MGIAILYKKNTKRSQNMANVRKRYTCEEVLAVLMESVDESDEKDDLDTDEEELINEGRSRFRPKFY